MNLPESMRWATRIRWQWKVFIPIIGVMALSIVVVTGVLQSLEVHNAHWIVLAALGIAILLCFMLLFVLLVLVERPLEELMKTIERVRHGDLSTRVEFAKRDDDIGRLGRQFNEMVEQLNESRRNSKSFINARWRGQSTWLRWASWRRDWRMKFATHLRESQGLWM